MEKLRKFKFPRLRKKTVAIIVAILLLLLAVIALAWDQFGPEPESQPAEQPEESQEMPPVAESALITKVSASVSPATYSSTSCSKTFTFTGKITTGKAGTVSYRWERSDGVKSAAKSLKFAKAETKSVSYPWLRNGDYSGWAVLKTTSPEAVSSSKASFTATCIFAVTKVTASVSPSTNDACIETYNFTGKITTNKAGTVKYKWERALDINGDGTPETAPSGSTKTVTFTKAETKTVSDSAVFGVMGYSPFKIRSIPTWLAWLRNLFAPIAHAVAPAGPVEGWERLKVTSPNSKTSNEAEFIYDNSYCSPI